MSRPDLHVGLNLIFLVPGETGGMEVAARELIPALIDAAEGVRFTAFINRETAAADGPWGELLPAVTVPVNARNRPQWVRGEQQYLPRLAADAGCEIVHSLGSTAPARGRFVRVTTIHDLNYKMVPQAHFGLLGLGMRVLVPLAARRSHRVLAVSESTRRDLIEHLHLRGDLIDVVPQGVSQTPTVTPTEEMTLRRSLGLSDGPFVLCVGAKRPHKNAVAVIEAISMMADSPQLVITGYRLPYEQQLRSSAEVHGVDLHMPAYLSVADLEGLYAAAACVAVPSLYEGFGMPVLEAMARGTPVICSDRSSLPEVAGEAALLFDPTSANSIRNAMESVVRDPAVAQRLSVAGRARAAQFTWQRTAQATLDSYTRALADSGHGGRIT